MSSSGQNLILASFAQCEKLRIFLPLSRIYVKSLVGHKNLFKMKLISHNFCQLIMTVKFLNFHTVDIGLVIFAGKE